PALPAADDHCGHWPCGGVLDQRGDLMSGCCTPVIVPAGGGGGGGEPGKTTGVVTLVDDNGPFLRHIVYGVNGVPESATDTDLSGVTGYSPTGAVAPYP